MSFARRQTKTSTSRHTTWQQKQALKLAIAFSWGCSRNLRPALDPAPDGVGLFVYGTRGWRPCGCFGFLVLKRCSCSTYPSHRASRLFHRSPTNVRAATTLVAARPDNHTVLRLPVITAAESWWWSSSHYAPVGSSL